MTGKKQQQKNCGFYNILNAVFTFYFPEDFPSQPQFVINCTLKYALLLNLSEQEGWLSPTERASAG